MPNIVLLTLEYPPQHGGVGTYLKGEVDASDTEVTVLQAQEYFWEKWPQWLPLFWHTCMQARKAQSIWISHVLPIGYIAWIYKKIFRTPYRVYVHGLDVVRPLQSQWKTFWVHKILVDADEVVVNSKATAQLLEPYGYTPEKARVQYPRIAEIDTQKYISVGEDLRSQYIIKNKPVVLTICRLVDRKGVDDVLKSMVHVWRTIPDAVYIIVGDGPQKRELEASIQPKKRKQVIFAGAVSEKEKYGWLATADVFIMTPKDDPTDFEGYGIVYKEAQQFDLPVIGSKVGGVPEAIGENGILVEAGNIQEIAQSLIKILQKNRPTMESKSKIYPEPLIQVRLAGDR